MTVLDGKTVTVQAPGGLRGAKPEPRLIRRVQLAAGADVTKACEPERDAASRSRHKRRSGWW